jgi:hypothetical protein
MAHRSEFTRYVNIGYTFGLTAPTLILLYLSYKKNYEFKNTLYPAFILMLIRALMRLTDIEGVKHKMPPDLWNNRENLHLTWGFLLTYSFLIWFWKNKGSAIIFIIMIMARHVAPYCNAADIHLIKKSY